MLTLVNGMFFFIAFMLFVLACSYLAVGLLACSWVWEEADPILRASAYRFVSHSAFQHNGRRESIVIAFVIWYLVAAKYFMYFLGFPIVAITSCVKSLTFFFFVIALLSIFEAMLHKKVERHKPTWEKVVLLKGSKP